MAASDWEEIKRLAADFQRAQLSSSSHKLSERNCIEIVNKLISLGLIEVIYTTDGKEYLTPLQLEKEIRDEVIVHGGRINLVDLQQIINVDLSHVENKVSEIIRRDHHFTLIQGELLDKDYLDRIAEEVNETLQENGQITIAEIAKKFNLPTEFLINAVDARLGTIIHGTLDHINQDVLFTQAFIARNVARIRGIFSALTRPTYVMHLVAQYGLPEKLFFSVLGTLLKSKRLSGSMQGRDEKSVFIPEIYSRAQTDYIDSFFKENGYIEYQTLSKLGITDGQKFLKKRFAAKKEACMYLSTCCVSQNLVDRVDVEIEEILRNESWGEIRWLLPSPLSDDDVYQLLQHCLKSPVRSSAHIFSHTITSQQYLVKCKNYFTELMTTKAQKDIKTSPALFAELSKKEKSILSTDSATGDGKQVKKDERQKKALAGAGLKGGSGRGARESVTKKTKNKYRDHMKEKDDDHDNNGSVGKANKRKQELPFMTVDEIFELLNEKEFDQGSNNTEFLQEIANYLHGPLTRDYQEVAKSIFLTSAGTSSVIKRKSHQEFQEKINGLWGNIRLFEKGLNLFEGDNKLQLLKHLLKTIGSDLVNIVFEMIANENLMSLSENENFTPDTRLKLLNKLPEPWKTPLTKLNSALNGKSLDEFFNQLDVITDGEHCDVMLKKVDKKKERQMLYNHRQALIDQLDRETEGAMALHLAVVILFQYHTNTLLHAPGKFVPQIIIHLQNNIDPADFEVLTEYHSLVVQQLKNRSKETRGENTDEKSVDILLSERLLDVKNIVKNMKKSSVSNENV